MKATIDPAGRLVLPKAAREALNLQGEAELDVRVVGEHVELEPLPLEVEVMRQDGFFVAVPRKPVAKVLTAEDVERTRRAILEEREAGQR